MLLLINKIIKQLFLLTFFFLFGCMERSKPVERASILKLITSPNQFDGKKVFVSGFLIVQHENHGLYFDKDFALNAVADSGVWLDIFQC